ncbi:MAG: hypothetical protein AAFX56_03680 [Pseudomonadota bacterium]
MKKTVNSLLVSGLLLAAAPSMACDYPARPDIPDGSTASLEEMQSASKSVKDYLGQVDEYLTCIEEEEKDAVAAMDEAPDDAELKRRSEMLDKRFDAANEEKELVGELFNQQVRAYKDKARAARN